MGAATLAMALGLGGLMHSRTTVAGTALPLADADAATYGVSAVYQLDDTTYYVVGSKQGFQSEVQAGVTLDRDGNVLDVKILAQAETDSLGAQCENTEFTAQYQGAAPFTLAGKSYTVTDPATGTAFAAAGSAETNAAPAEAFDPAAWRAGDTSPEAEATRKMYEAGLTLSALNGQPMYAACLSKSAQDGEKQAVPYADWSAEKQAEYKLQAADLTTQGSAADTVSADMTQVDALSGATITSTAVTDIVNNSYFYVTEVLCAE